jgi:hypothetical protein
MIIKMDQHFHMLKMKSDCCALYTTSTKAGCSGVRVQVGAGNFSPTTASRPALGPTQSPIQWVPGALYLGV